VVGEPIEQGAGQAFGTEHFGPFLKRQVAGDQGRAALVALAGSVVGWRNRCALGTSLVAA